MRYRRLRNNGGTYFFTVNLENRKQDLLVRHIDLLRRSFRRVKRKHPFKMAAFVILPDHLHCIWTLPEHDHNYSERWRLIKTNFSMALPKTENTSLSRDKKGERGIWQRRFWEHQIRDDYDFQQHIQYIHNNPVKHGYCQKPSDWPHSSVGWVELKRDPTHHQNTLAQREDPKPI